MVQVVAAVIPNTKGQYLISQRNSPRGRGMWEFPGGKIDQGETLEAAVTREMIEEIGAIVIPVRRVHELDITFEWGQYHVTFFLCGTDEIDRIHGAEGQPIEWVYPVEGLTYNTFEGDHQVFQKILADPELFRL